MIDEISPPFVVFSKNVFILGKRYYERNQTKNDLLEHFVKVKNASRHKKHQHVIHGLEKIEMKMSELIEKEKKLAETGIHKNEEVAEISKKLLTLQNELSMERGIKESLINKINQIEQQLSKEIKSKQSLTGDIEYRNVLLNKKKSEINEIRRMVASFREKLRKHIEEAK